MNAGAFFVRRTNSHPSRWRKTVKVFMRSAVFVVGLLASPVALMAQAAAATRIDSVATQTAANSTSINFVWTLVAGFLVMFMQAGFALVETGFTRAKNAGHTMTMNFMVYAIGMLAYWAVGFALQAGGIGALATLGGYDKLNTEFSINIGGHAWGLFGMQGFFLTGVAYNAPSSRTSSFRWCSWTPPRRFPPARPRSDGSSPP